MLNKKIADELNRQLNMELSSAYAYLAMAAYCDSINMEGSGKWLKLQAKEEMGHAMKFYGYINDMGVAISLGALSQPGGSFKGLKEVFVKALEHEQAVTKSISGIATLALQEGDHTTYSFLNWFLEEQVEEESTANKILARLDMVGQDARGLFLLDCELGRRSEG